MAEPTEKRSPHQLEGFYSRERDYTKLPDVVAELEDPEVTFEQLEVAGLPLLAQAVKHDAPRVAREVLHGNPVFGDHRDLILAGRIIDIADLQPVEYETFVSPSDVSATTLKHGESTRVVIDTPTDTLNRDLAERWLSYVEGYGQDHTKNLKITPEIAMACALARIDRIDHKPLADEAVADLVRDVGVAKAAPAISRYYTTGL